MSRTAAAVLLACAAASSTHARKTRGPMPETPWEHVITSEAVVLARVAEVRPDGQTSVARLTVHESWKGRPPASLLLRFVPRSIITPRFRAGTTVVAFLGNRGGEWSASHVVRVRPAEAAALRDRVIEAVRLQDAGLDSESHRAEWLVGCVRHASLREDALRELLGDPGHGDPALAGLQLRRPLPIGDSQRARLAEALIRQPPRPAEAAIAATLMPRGEAEDEIVLRAIGRALRSERGFEWRLAIDAARRRFGLQPLDPSFDRGPGNAGWTEAQWRRAARRAWSITLREIQALPDGAPGAPPVE